MDGYSQFAVSAEALKGRKQVIAKISSWPATFGSISRVKAKETAKGGYETNQDMFDYVAIVRNYILDETPRDDQGRNDCEHAQYL